VTPRPLTLLKGRATPPSQLIGSSTVMRALNSRIAQLAAWTRSEPDAFVVLIQGESGSGKDLVARSLHTAARGTSGEFLPLNVTAIASGLFESSLFGHERGAFTTALHKHTGALERAGKGTLFLDEIGDLRLESQANVATGRRITRIHAHWRATIAALRWSPDRRIQRRPRPGCRRRPLSSRPSAPLEGVSTLRAVSPGTP
jgi:DNA-binding NtrC family response regulator